jgi:hypothetical protein
VECSLAEDEGICSLPVVLWHRVVPAFTKRLAAKDTPGTHKAPPERTMTFNGFAGIYRATGGKTALLPEYRAEPVSIEFYACQQELFQKREVLIRVVWVTLLHIGLAPNVKLSYNFVAFRLPKVTK